MAPRRATGANVLLHGKIASAYGEAATGNYLALAAYSYGVAAMQELLDEPLLGYGRDPLPPQRGAIDVTGGASVPLDQRIFGFWLRLLLGDEIGSPAQIGARGFIAFSANPTAASTITLNGQAWTFVASGATGPQTNIGVSLAATLTQLATDLNASGDTDITPATYSADASRLLIQHDTADNTGNVYTLAASLASKGKVSGTTLKGGGLYRHTWHSGAVTLPDASIQSEHQDLEGGSERFFVSHGVLANTLQIERSRSGAVKAAIELIGQTETRHTSTQAGTPVELDVDIFSQFNGSIWIDGVGAANMTGATLAFSNNLDIVEALRNDGAIEGADPGQTSLGFSFKVRYSNEPLKTAAFSETPVVIQYGFRDPVGGAELLFEASEIHLPRPKREISGPGGIEVTYEAKGAQAISIGRAMTVSLINDQSAAY